MRVCIFSLFIFSSVIFSDYYDYIYKDRSPSLNSFGQSGLIQTPSAKTMGENSIYFTLNKNAMWKYGSLTATPYDWMEASYFYYRPRDLRWLPGSKINYLDKGFNVKFSYNNKKSNTPSLAIGLDDIGGTGYFAREYIVSTLDRNRFNFTIGMGWGKFNNISNFSNPLGFISEKFDERGASENFDSGGNFATDTWFRGDASMFGGIEIYLPKTNGMKLKLEHDPFDYFNFSASKRSDADIRLRNKDSNLNLGISLPINDYLNLEASFIKGNTFNLSFTIGANFNKVKIKKDKFKPIVKNKPDETRGGFYKDLLFNLNKNRLFLQTADIDFENNELLVAITNSDYRNQIRASSFVALIANQTYKMHDLDINKITVSNINVGIETSKISYYSDHITKQNTPIEVVKNYSILDSGNTNSFKDYDFKPVLKFPILFHETTPNIVSHVGSPEKFYFGGIILQNSSELLFRRNLILSTRLNVNITNNFDETVDRPASDLPNVRTDVVKYLQQSKDLHIENMQLDYFFTPKKDIYARISSGLFERMYGGLGLEVIYKPYKRNYYVGLETFHIKKRGFDSTFNFLKYETQTSHMFFNFFYEPLDMNLNLSYGKYLADDVGYTFDLSRISKLGIRSGFFFTRTDVPPEIFGEGSFDKGFYFQIPLDIFSKKHNNSYTNFKLKPLTRDGGQKLEHQKSLQSIIYNSSSYELNRQWSGFLD